MNGNRNKNKTLPYLLIPGVILIIIGASYGIFSKDTYTSSKQKIGKPERGTAYS